MGAQPQSLLQEWIDNGTLGEHLMDTSMLVMQGRSKKDIA